MAKTGPNDCDGGSERRGEPAASGSGSGTGKAAPPPTTDDQKNDRFDPSKEVTTIPIGMPESAETFQQRKERARKPSPAGDVNVASDQEE